MLRSRDRTGRNPNWTGRLALLAVGNRLRSRGPGSEPGVEPERETSDPSIAPAEPPAPHWLYDVVNPLMERLLRSPLHGLVSDSIMLITFTGRKTGTEYTTPVGYRQTGDRLVVFTHSDWWKNLRGGQPVTVHLRGVEREGVAEPSADPEIVADHVRRFVEMEGVEQARRIGLRVEGEELPDDEELADGLEGTVVIEIELQD